MAGTRKVSTAQDAQIAEAKAVELKTVDYKGVTYVVPDPLDVSVDLLEAEGELEVVKAVLGDAQYGIWRATKPTLRDLREFGDALVQAVGFDDLGN